jgi:N-methylhydantoinase B/oxoprolinase/acetone carboxylase alpha subunit
MLDRITVSVLQLRLEAIVQEMGEAMLRTAYSQILNSSRDFSTAVCDGEGRLAAQAEHVPIHVGAMPWAVQSIRNFFTGRIHPGDMFLLNNPYHWGGGWLHRSRRPRWHPVCQAGECRGRSRASLLRQGWDSGHGHRC